MKKEQIATILCLFLLPLYGFAYTYGDRVDLPAAAAKLLPEDADILASAAADLNGDGRIDYAVILQKKESDADGAAPAAADEGRRSRELFIITAQDDGYAVAARSTRAVLCSDCGAEGEDPFLNLRARTKSFTVLHKFKLDSDGTWGTAARFRYSAEDGTWLLDYFYGHEGAELAPADFGRIDLEDFDLGYYLAVGVLARPASAEKTTHYPDDILFTEDGVAFAVRPDGTDRRYLAGDRFFRTMGFPCWSADKKRIAFVRRGDLYVADADGSRERRLVRNMLGESYYRYWERGEVTGMRWSPDGLRFAYSGYRDTVNYKTVYLFLADPSGRTKILKEGDAKHPIGSFCWSPDSGKLAYYYGGVLIVQDLASGTERSLSEKPGSGIAWSADGARILTVVPGAYGIVDVASGAIREIKGRAWAGYGPLFWSADEKYALIYTSDDIMMAPIAENGRGRIVAARSEGLIDGLSW